jgi:hypothetical protein
MAQKVGRLTKKNEDKGEEDKLARRIRREGR